MHKIEGSIVQFKTSEELNALMFCSAKLEAEFNRRDPQELLTAMSGGLNLIWSAVNKRAGLHFKTATQDVVCTLLREKSYAIGIWHIPSNSTYPLAIERNVPFAVAVYFRRGTHDGIREAVDGLQTLVNAVGLQLPVQFAGAVNAFTNCEAKGHCVLYDLSSRVGDADFLRQSFLAGGMAYFAGMNADWVNNN